MTVNVDVQWRESLMGLRKMMVAFLGVVHTTVEYPELAKLGTQLEQVFEQVQEDLVIDGVAPADVKRTIISAGLRALSLAWRWRRTCCRCPGCP